MWIFSNISLQRWVQQVRCMEWHTRQQLTQINHIDKSIVVSADTTFKHILLLLLLLLFYSFCFFVFYCLFSRKLRSITTLITLHSYSILAMRLSATVHIVAHTHTITLNKYYVSHVYHNASHLISKMFSCIIYFSFSYLFSVSIKLIYLDTHNAK